MARHVAVPAWLGQGLGLLVLLALAGATAGDQSGFAECSVVDHEECDLQCKRDGDWFGRCERWDGSELACHCEPYVWPLRSGAQGPCYEARQADCEDDCSARTALGGFCEVLPGYDAATNLHACRCFQDLYDFSWQPLRRRR